VSDESSSGSEEPGPRYEYREILIQPNKSKGQSSEESDEDEMEKDANDDDPIDPEKEQKMWRTKTTSSQKGNQKNVTFISFLAYRMEGKYSFLDQGTRFPFIKRVI
jgi:hypothetical protein